MVVNHAVDEIIPKENNKVSAKTEAHENIESEIYDNDLYQIDNMSFDDMKENTEQRKRAFKIKLENIYDIEIQKGMTCIHRNKLNKLAECNLQHNILNPPKHTKNLNSHYSTILQ